VISDRRSEVLFQSLGVDCRIHTGKDDWNVASFLVVSLILKDENKELTTRSAKYTFGYTNSGSAGGFAHPGLVSTPLGQAGLHPGSDEIGRANPTSLISALFIKLRI
jgi:hypothetical protein